MQHYVTRFFILFALVTLAAGCEEQAENQQQGTDVQPEPKPIATEQQHKELVVEASCGQCQFGLPGKGCDLAVRIDGKAYYVDCTGIDDHGDAHSDDGFCNAVSRARVKGRVENSRFVAISLELLPDDNE